MKDVEDSEVLTPEDYSETQVHVRATTDRFMAEEVTPRIPELERQTPGLARQLMKQAAQLGLLGVMVPEHHDGLEMGVATQMLVSERLGPYASFSTTYAAHAGIGTLPLVFFGSEEQKRRYLPRLLSGEMLAAYCLTEPHAGSDALAARTRAELTPDGKHYVLNGQKMWISNGGWADLFTVFAKVDGKRFTAFLVERCWGGVQPGPEEHKMGLRGSSTTALYLDNVMVPVANVLGEIGRGHVIAFNILNVGRLELAASCVGGAKDLIAESVRYAQQRKAFGKLIAEFGAVRKKLADMAVRTFAGEALTYRTAGMIDARLDGMSWKSPDASTTALRAVEEYAIECSIAKVYLSEALDFIADEAVQIHGGYGYHEDYAVERGYRDSRINRIFEGTNEINRQLTASMLCKRADQGRLDLAGSGVPSRPRPAYVAALHARIPLAYQTDLVNRAKRAALAVIRMANRRVGADLDQHQEVAAAVADMLMHVYAAESALLRGKRLIETAAGDSVDDLLTVLLIDTTSAVRAHGGLVLGACCSESEIGTTFQALDNLVRARTADLPKARGRIARRMLESGGFEF